MSYNEDYYNQILESYEEGWNRKPEGSDSVIALILIIVILIIAII